MSRTCLNLARPPLLLLLILVTTPPAVWAQTSPFAQGAQALQSSLLSILTPVAVIAVMVIGVAAWFNRISWSWAAGGAMGIMLVFGAPQVVQWIRSMAGV
jgi:type IV secretion system protein VirB2